MISGCGVIMVPGVYSLIKLIEIGIKGIYTKIGQEMLHKLQHIPEEYHVYVSTKVNNLYRVVI